MSKVRPVEILEDVEAEEAATKEDDDAESVSSLCLFPERLHPVWPSDLTDNHRISFSLSLLRSDFYTIRHEKSRIMHDKEALQVLYDGLAEKFSSLRNAHVRRYV